jgi:putative MATE family efflux protein
MRDLTQGSIARHIVLMALPIAAGMGVQTLYYLVDLYFISRLGAATIAGVSAAGNVMFVVLGLTQMLSVGTVALISHAVGRKDRAQARLVFNQSVSLALVCGLVTLAGVAALAGPYMRSVSADAASVRAGLDYLYAFAPGLALQFALVAMGAALRGTGVVKPTLLVQMATVLINIVLAPVLIAGWGTGRPLGAMGAGLASTLAVLAGVLLTAYYFHKLESYVGFERRDMLPRLAIVRRMLAIGVPAGGEFVMLFVFMGVIYSIISAFGPAAQAGFGIGSRVMQAIFLPGMAVSFAVPAIAGQNFGAGHALRVRETLRQALMIETAIMLALTLLCQISPASLIGGFSTDGEVIATGAQFLHIISWNFIAMGVVFACSGMFQALGNTWPGLFSMALRLLTFALPAWWLSQQAGFRIEQVWYVSVASVALQGLTSFTLARMELAKRLVLKHAAETAPA